MFLNEFLLSQESEKIISISCLYNLTTSETNKTTKKMNLQPLAVLPKRKLTVETRHKTFAFLVTCSLSFPSFSL